MKGCNKSSLTDMLPWSWVVLAGEFVSHGVHCRLSQHWSAGSAEPKHCISASKPCVELYLLSLVAKGHIIGTWVMSMQGLEATL